MGGETGGCGRTGRRDGCGRTTLYKILKELIKQEGEREGKSASDFTSNSFLQPAGAADRISGFVWLSDNSTVSMCHIFYNHSPTAGQRVLCVGNCEWGFGKCSNASILGIQWFHFVGWRANNGIAGSYRIYISTF